MKDNKEKLENYWEIYLHRKQIYSEDLEKIGNLGESLKQPWVKFKVNLRNFSKISEISAKFER